MKTLGRIVPIDATCPNYWDEDYRIPVVDPNIEPRRFYGPCPPFGLVTLGDLSLDEGWDLLTQDERDALLRGIRIGIRRWLYENPGLSGLGQLSILGPLITTAISTAARFGTDYIQARSAQRAALQQQQQDLKTQLTLMQAQQAHEMELAKLAAQRQVAIPSGVHGEAPGAPGTSALDWKRIAPYVYVGAGVLTVGTLIAILSRRR